MYEKCYYLSSIIQKLAELIPIGKQITVLIFVYIFIQYLISVNIS